MLKISVIVPVYNSEKYLARCVDSILNQTYTDIELILVEDGSPDNCPTICDNYAAADNRVRVIHKQNGGVSTARNAGLDVATGDYIAFVDSDDYIEPDMYEKMMNKVKEYNCDIVLCDCLKEYEDYSEIYSHNVRQGYYNNDQLKSEYYPHLLIMENVEYPATISNWLMLWKKKLNTVDMRYEPGIKYSEDLLFGARLMLKAESFYYMKDEAYYHYMMNPDSVTHTYAPDKWDNYVRLYHRIKEVFESYSEYDFSHQINLCLLFFIYNSIGEIYSADMSTKEKKLKIYNILNMSMVREMFKAINFFQLDISFKLKVITLMYKHRFGILLLIKYYGRS